MIYLKDDNLEELIKSGVHIVDFYAEWCGPCKMMEPIIESISNEYSIIKIDIDKFKKLTIKNRIMSVPTIKIYKDGKELKELIGFKSKEDLINELQIINTDK